MLRVRSLHRLLLSLVHCNQAIPVIPIEPHAKPLNGLQDDPHPITRVRIACNVSFNLNDVVLSTNQS